MTKQRQEQVPAPRFTATQTQMPRHQHKNTINNSLENMSPLVPEVPLRPENCNLTEEHVVKNLNIAYMEYDRGP